MTISRENVFEDTAQAVTNTNDLKDFGFKRKDTVILHYTVQAVRWSRITNLVLNLPTNSNWTNLVIITSVINFIAGTVFFYFDREHLMRFIPVYHLCDLIYLLNFISLSIHRYWSGAKKLPYTVRVSKFRYITDAISLLPQEIIAVAIFGSKSTVCIYFRWITYIRLRNLFEYGKLLSQVLKNRWKVFSLAFFANVLVIQHFFTCLMYDNSCHHLRCDDAKLSQENNSTLLRLRRRDGFNESMMSAQKLSIQWYHGKWSESIILHYAYYETASAWDWYLLSTYAVMEVFLNVGSGTVVPLTIYEMNQMTFIMLCGYILFTILFLSFSFHMFTIVRKSRADYLFKIESIKCFLYGSVVSQKVKRNIDDYFNILWQKKDGIKSAAHFSTLPTPLQMEIMYDINCAHLNRSLLFFDLKEFYLRTLSLFMKHEFILPGDIIFHQGVVKRSLIVIIKGILEVLSDEDDESPIIAFEAGTVLGEACLFFSLPSKATVRAAVYTEIKMISRVDFIRTMSNYPVALFYLRDRIYSRIKAAKKNAAGRRAFAVKLDIDNRNKKSVPIKAFKDKLIERQQKAALYKDLRRTAFNDPMVSEFFHNILALYRLSNEDSNIETPVVCLTYKFPWILDSTSSLVMIWEKIIIAVHLISLIIFSYQAVFLRELQKIVVILMFFSDVVCIMDVILLTMTSVVLKNRVLKTFKEIVSYRLKMVDFYIYAMPLFPYEYFFLGDRNPKEETQSRLYALLSGIKILRLRRCYTLLHHLEAFHSKNNLVFPITYTIIYVFFLTYLSGCILYLTSCFYEVCSEDSWFYKLIQEAVKNKERLPCYEFPFETSMYFAVNIWMHMGFGDIKPILPRDLAIFVIYMIVGLIFLTYIISSLAASIYVVHANVELFQQEVFSFQRFLDNYKVPMELKQEVIRFFAIRWSYDRAIGRIQFKQMAPYYAQIEVFKVNLMRILNSVPLFQIIDVDFLMDIILTSNVTILPEGATVCYSGDVDREMFIVQKGCCALFDFRGMFVRSIKTGEYFGDIEMLFNMSKAYTVRTTTNCSLVQITFRSLMSSISMFPGEMVILNKVLKNKDFVNLAEAIELKKFISFMEKVDQKIIKKKKRKVNIFRKLQSGFIITANCYKMTDGREKYWTPFKKMGRWQIFGLVLMPITIHPDSAIVKVWLISRMILLALMGICFPSAIGLPPTSTVMQHVIISMVEYTAYIELYLFLHIAYYNHDGLLITHPKLTARHYLANGFLMDFISAFPYYAVFSWFGSYSDNLDQKVAHLFHRNAYSMWRAFSFLQYHRYISCMYYLQSDVLSKKNFFNFFVVLPFVFLILLIGTTIIIKECRYEFFTEKIPIYEELSQTLLYEPSNNTVYYGYLLCRQGSWLQYVSYFKASSPTIVIVLAFYWFLNIFSKVGLGDVNPNTDFGMYCFITVAFMGIAFFAYILAFLSGQTGRSSKLALDYQEKVQELLNFLNKEEIAENKINKIYRYFEYVWKRTTGMENKEMLMDLNSALKGDIALMIYERTLRDVLIFRRIARPYLRVIAKNLREEYFLRSDILIKCYDVHNSVYIILRGTVNVLTPYDDVIATIGSGGIFGNLHQAVPSCSSVTFMAERNVDALKITSEMFYLIAQEYPAVKEVLEKGLKNAGDYILSKRRRNEDDQSSFSFDFETSYDEIEIMSKTYELDDVERQPIPQNAESAPTTTADTTQRFIMPKNKCLVCLLFLKPKYWFKFALEPNHIIFKYVWYVTFLATFYQMLMIPYMFASQNFKSHVLYTTMCLEPVFYIRIFFFMHEAYLDDYGTYIRKFKLILRNYLKDRQRVYWDVIPNIPLYIIFPFVPQKHRLFVFSCLRLFHLLRWRYIFEAFAVWSAPLMAKRAPLLILKMIVLYLSMAHYFACVGILVFSDFGDVSKSTRDYLRNEHDLNIYLISLYYITQIVSTTGTGDTTPENTTELYFTIAVIISTKFSYCILIVCFLMGIRILFQNITNYENKVTNMKKFLRNQGLSDHLMEKLWMYIKQIWKRESGSHMPELLENAPYVLKCEIMREIYSVHLRKGYLFKDINEALLTQICGHLKRVVFFKGNYIVQDGDTNASMYWIHRGKVSVLTVHPNLTETQHEILNVHDMFGLAQGLNYGLPHKYSYRAETECDILILQLETWEFVLQQFPTDKEIIYRRMMNIYTIF